MKRSLILLALTSLACRGETPPAGDGGPQEPASTPSNRTAVGATVRANLGITFAKVERRQVARMLREQLAAHRGGQRGDHWGRPADLAARLPLP